MMARDFDAVVRVGVGATPGFLLAYRPFQTGPVRTPRQEPGGFVAIVGRFREFAESFGGGDAVVVVGFFAATLVEGTDQIQTDIVTTLGPTKGFDLKAIVVGGRPMLGTNVQMVRGRFDTRQIPRMVATIIVNVAK
jgi:hypothetical protein